MSMKVSRRTVKVAGIIAMLAMTAEWAVVAWGSGSFAAPVASSEVGNSIWSAESSGYPVLSQVAEPRTDAPCVSTAIFAPAAGITSAEAAGSVGDSSSGRCLANDSAESFVLQMSVSPSLCTTVCVDLFEVYAGTQVNPSTLEGVVTVYTTSESGAGATAYTATMTVYADFGSPSPSGDTQVTLVVSAR